MKHLSRRLAALEAQQPAVSFVVVVGECDDPTKPQSPYRNCVEYVIDPSEPFDYDRAIAMIARKEPL